MNKRSSLFLSVLLAVIMLFPAVNVTGNDVEDVQVIDETPSRYGFTPVFKEVADPTEEAICVATGDFDGANNDDLAIGLRNSIMIMTNNGGTGSSFNMNPGTPIDVTGYYITRIRVADYDGDSDLDIIALGQDEYLMSGDPPAGPSQVPTIHKMAIFYIENQAGSFSVEDIEYFDGAVSLLRLWYYTDSKFDLDVGDVDGDGDIDTVVAWLEDTDSTDTTGAEQVTITLVEYESGSLSNSTIQADTYSAIGECTPLVRLADFDLDDNLDLVYSYGGQLAGGSLDVRLFVKWHTGSGANWGTPIDLDPNDQMIQGGIFGSWPYAIAVGDFGGDADLIDIAVATNRNGGTNPSFGDAGVFMIRTKDDREFTDPESVYSQEGDFMFRGMAVGNLDDSGRDDLVCFTKQDQTGPPDDEWYNAIDGYGLSLLSSRGMFPYRFNALKVFESPDHVLPNTPIKSVAVGNFDNDAVGYDDVVYVGDVVRVAFTTFPPNEVPQKKKATVTPSPVLNNNNIANINLTIEDLDGSWDLTRIEVDFTPIGMAYKTINEPILDFGNSTIGWYTFDIEVPPTVMQGDYNIKFYMFDKYNDGPDKNTPKSNDTFLFRVKQYNRRPEVVLDEGNRTLYVKEDTPTYFEGIYDWFSDADIEGGYAPDLLNISMRSFNSDTYVTTSTLSNAERKIMRVDLKNGSDSNPQDWSLLITPDPNFYHPELESAYVILRGSDGVLHTNPNLRLKVVILSVNDNPSIPVQKRFESDKDWEFSLVQDETTVSFPITATDKNDGDTEDLEFFFEYDDPADEEWLYISRIGMVSWFPENEHVGSHMVTLWVSDGEANISKVLWFNVSNTNDRPYVVSISNGTTTITNVPRHIEERYEFIVNEHEEFSLTIIADDLDRMIGLQDDVGFQCNLTLLNNTFLDVDENDPFKATFHFMAEMKFGYFATYLPDNPPIETEIIITDGMNQDIMVVIPIRIIINNVNDPPILVEIDEPVDGSDYQILYNVPFSAGQVLDPDTTYNDTLIYQWDFDASDGEFSPDSLEVNGFWDFPASGNYMITLRIVDSAGNYLEAYTNVSVSGYKDDDDFDNDGLPNKWEDEFGLDKYDPSDATENADGDGLTNIEEYWNLTDPTKRDSDGDGSLDGDDFSPIDPTVWNPPKDDDGGNENLIWIIIVIAIIILIIAAIVAFFLVRSMKKSKEEEERRKQAEAMQKTAYEDQDLYSNLPEGAAAVETGAVAAAPSQPQLPPQEDGSLDDIFGGAGTLPGMEAGQQSLPPGTDEPQPQAPAPQQTGDVTDLLDQ